MASATFFRATPQWASRTTAEQMDSVCPPLIVRHVSFDRVLKVPSTLLVLGDRARKGDLVLSPDMEACKMTPEPYIATIKLAPPLNQVLQNVPFDRLIFPSYSIDAARKSILESVQLELTEIPDLRRMDPETLQKLT